MRIFHLLPARPVHAKKTCFFDVAIRCSFTPILFALLAFAPSAVAQQVSDCMTCHGDSSLTTADSTGKEISLFVDLGQLENSMHAGFDCVTCHADVTEIPHAEQLAPAACGTCHEDALAAVAEGAHGKNAVSGAVPEDAPSCGACHSSHNILAKTDSLSWVNPRRLAFTCGACHGNPKFALKHQIPIKNPIEGYVRSVHGRLAIAGMDSAATCSSCHDYHQILPANNSASKVYHFNVPQTCGQCHAQITAEFENSVHGAAVARGSRDAPVCTDCHSEHGIESSSVATAPTSPQNLAVETCGRCHASTRLVEKYGMRGERLSTFADSYHGLALRSGRVTVANCASCHGVHNILPSSDPRSMIHTANLAKTCGQCHPNAGENFAAGPVHLTAAESEGRAVAVIRAIYLGLIIVVIGAMFLHNALDFARKSGHKLRRVQSLE